MDLWKKVWVEQTRRSGWIPIREHGRYIRNQFARGDADRTRTPNCRLKQLFDLPMYKTTLDGGLELSSLPPRGMENMDKVRALIVDDSSVMRKIVERSLRQAGLDLEKVVEASDGSEALVVLGKEKVDLILCDINMPVMDGLQFVKSLGSVENAKGVPVVMITTEGSENFVVQALSAGARGYIRKPFTPEQVKEHVLPLVGKKS